MRYFLSPQCVLKRLESPSCYHIGKDELYELDEEGFDFLTLASRPEGVGGNTDPMFLKLCVNDKILTTDYISIKRPVIRPFPRPSLRYLELQITRRCNLRCGHCYIGPPTTEELSSAEISAIVREFQDLQGLRLLITGGEPLMHRSFWEINDLLGEVPLRKVLVTNGTLLGEPGRAGKLSVHEVQVSIDGIGDSHDALRGPGTYLKALKALEEVRAAGLDLSVSTMVHPANLAEFDEMAKLFQDFGARAWTVDVPCVSGNLTGNTGFQLVPAEAGKYMAYGWGEGLHGGSAEGFACGLHLMTVMADGTCARCAFYAETPVGRIEEGLETCWARIKPTPTDELSCAGCDALESCRGGCRWRAGLGGDPLAKDQYKCALLGKP